jgi:hypothetical protein
MPEKQMKLSDGEKLILMMLSEIYEHLKTNGTIDHNLIRTATFGGNCWGLRWHYNSVLQDREGHGHHAMSTPAIVAGHAEWIPHVSNSCGGPGPADQCGRRVLRLVA